MLVTTNTSAEREKIYQRGYNAGVLETIMKIQKIMEQTFLDILNNRIKIDD